MSRLDKVLATVVTVTTLALLLLTLVLGTYHFATEDASFTLKLCAISMLWLWCIANGLFVYFLHQNMLDWRD